MTEVTQLFVFMIVSSLIYCYCCSLTSAAIGASGHCIQARTVTLCAKWRSGSCIAPRIDDTTEYYTTMPYLRVDTITTTSCTAQLLRIHSNYAFSSSRPLLDYLVNYSARLDDIRNHMQHSTKQADTHLFNDFSCALIVLPRSTQSSFNSSASSLSFSIA